MDHDELTNSAFLDIATNLLAVILIVTLFSLVAVQHKTHSSTHPAAQPNPTLRFVEPQRDLFPPFSTFFFVTSDRVARWDQTAVIDALLANPQSLSGTTPQGRYEWLPEVLITRDIDTFQINFFLDHPAVLNQEPPFSETMADRLIADLTQTYQNARTAPVFIVYPSGMETFTLLYARLQNAGLRFRWFARRADEPLYLGRHPAQFTDHAIYW
ncbi:MAG: hypothetical protein F9K25_08710 [Candidatus Contendobacter sp.]|nr:MAG: hypothetical protein F9K25_08710 [Candidatus Contendobacter sp.]